MSKEPDNVILRLLREVRDNQKKDSIRLEAIEGRMEEMHETMYSAVGMAAHANIRHDSVTDELKTLRKRVEKLEKKA